MKNHSRPNHRILAEALRKRVLDGPGVTEPALRGEVAASAAEGIAAQAPFDALARQIGEAAYRTTDAQLANVVSASGSEKASFEVILAAAVRCRPPALAMCSTSCRGGYGCVCLRLSTAILSGADC